MGRMENPQSGSPIGAITWTDVFDNPAGIALIPVLFANGITMAVLTAANTGASADDGMTWNPQTLDISANTGTLFGFGNGLWLAVLGTLPATNSCVVWISTDNGVTWTGGAVQTGLQGAPAGGSQGSLATNGAGTWVMNGLDLLGNPAVSTSVDDGATWTVSHPLAPLFEWQLNSMIWDGTQFAALAVAASGDPLLATSADGITWASVDLSPGEVDDITPGIAFDGVQYMVGVANTNNVRVASTPAGLATAADTPTGLVSAGGIGFVYGADGQLLAFGASDDTFANSNDGATWFTGITVAGGIVKSVTYDPSTQTWIAGNSANSALQGKTAGAGGSGVTLSSSCKSGAMGQL